MVLAALSSWSLLFPLLVVLLRWHRLDDVQLSLAVYLVVAAGFEGMSNILWPAFEWSNLPLLHLYTFVQFILLAWVYRVHLHKTLSLPLQRAFLGGFALFVVLNALWLDGIENFNPHARAVESILLVVLALSYFYSLMREMRIARLESDSLFWISCAVLLYFSGSFLLFIVSKYISSSEPVMLTVWGIHSVLNILANIIYVIALWVCPKN